LALIQERNNGMCRRLLYIIFSLAALPVCAGTAAGKQHHTLLPSNTVVIVSPDPAMIEAGVKPLSALFDTLIGKDRKQTICRVMAIEDHLVACKMNENEAEIRLIPVDQIGSIHFENGFTEDFSMFKFSLSASEFYRMGAADARLYYPGQFDFRKGILDGALTYFFYTGIVLFVIDVKKPPALLTEHPDRASQALLRNDDYCKGYLNTAGSIKRNKLLGGFFTGLVALPVSIGILAFMSAGL
jgi:hypothetical protein